MIWLVINFVQRKGLLNDGYLVGFFYIEKIYKNAKLIINVLLFFAEIIISRH